jgi:hypothetical protein
VTVTRDGRLLVGLEREYIKGHGGAFLLDPAKPPAEAVVWFFPTADRGIGEWQGGIVGSIAINDEYLPEDGGGRLAAFTSVDGNVYVVSVDETDGTAKGPDGKTAYPKPKLVFSDRIGGSISTPAFARGALVAAGYDNRVHLYRIDYAAASEGVAVTNADGSSTSVGIRETDTFEAGLPSSQRRSCGADGSTSAPVTAISTVSGPSSRRRRARSDYPAADRAASSACTSATLSPVVVIPPSSATKRPPARASSPRRLPSTSARASPVSSTLWSPPSTASSSARAAQNRRSNPSNESPPPAWTPAKPARRIAPKSGRTSPSEWRIAAAPASLAVRTRRA